MEFWDIYDENKNLTGRTMKRNDWNMQPGEYHLTVLAILRRPDGRYLITQRSQNKAWAAGCWEIPGGGVMAKESSQEAIQREILEETGLDVSGIPYVNIDTYRSENAQEKNNYFVDIYTYEFDFKEEDVTIQTEEASGFLLATREEICRFAEEGRFLHFQRIAHLL